MQTIHFKYYLLCWSILFAANVSAVSKKKQIEKLQSTEDARYKYMVAADTFALAKILASDVAYFHSNGNLDSKQSFLNSIATKELIHKKIQITSQKIRIYKRTAIITGEATYDIVWKEKPMLLEFVFTNVYVKKKGKWLLVNRNTVKI